MAVSRAVIEATMRHVRTDWRATGDIAADVPDWTSASVRKALETLHLAGELEKRQEPFGNNVRSLFRRKTAPSARFKAIMMTILIVVRGGRTV